MKILVLATAETYSAWIKSNDLGPMRYRRIISHEGVRGYKDTILLNLGNRWLHKELELIYGVCRMSNIDVIHVDTQTPRKYA